MQALTREREKEAVRHRETERQRERERSDKLLKERREQEEGENKGRSWWNIYKNVKPCTLTHLLQGLYINNLYREFDRFGDFLFSL